MNTSTKTTRPQTEEAIGIDTFGNLQLGKAQLTHEQINELIDTTKRLQSMAILGTPTLPNGAFTGLQMDLALHALLTAYMSIADAFPLHTRRAALMAERAGLSLHTLAVRRACLFPQQVQ